ncbi:MAG: hypothetical protein PVG89_16365 [Gammaproteobacteria bacterium]|jgi:hypothetical protein
MTTHISNTVTQSPAHEAFVSPDGQIHKRDTSYETTIDTHSGGDSTMSTTVTAVNDPLHDEFPVLLDRVTNDIGIIKGPNLLIRRIGILLVSILVIIIFASTLLSMFKGPEPVDRATSKITAKPGASSSRNQLSQIPNTMELILQDNLWNNERLNTIITGWEKMAASNRHELTKTSQYELFVFHLRRELQLVNDLESGHQRVSYKDNLEKLALIMDVPANKQPTPENGQYQQMMRDLAREIAEVEQSVSTHRQNGDESEQALNQRLRKQLAASAQKQDNKKPGATNPPDSTPAYSELFTNGRIDELLSQYQQAYKDGKLEKLLSLFNADQLGKKRIENLKRNFQPIFANTHKRTVTFSDFNWSADSDVAIVNSKYRATLYLKNNKGTQEVSAQAVIRIRAVKNSLLISSINLVNSQTSVDRPKNNQVTISKQQHSVLSAVDNKLPTPAQLQDITTQLISAYEAGNIKRFSALFADDVKSNDRLDLAGLKQDYENLFNTTSDRQMFIQNIKWETESIGAKGTGDLQVLVFSEAGSEVYSLEGKIQIVAQLIGNEAKITHLYHIERQK